MLSVFVLGNLLLFLDVESHPAVLGSLGASSFIAFAMPEAQVSRPRFLIGGYIVGIIVGTVFFFLSQFLLSANLDISEDVALPMLAAAAVGFSIFVMVVFDLEHPPASGLALGLVINEWSIRTLVVVLCGIMLLSGLKSILRPMLKNLL